MENEKDLKKALEIYERELKRDRMEIDAEKKKFADKIKNGLGDKINDFNTYIKQEPSLAFKIREKIKRFFKYI